MHSKRLMNIEEKRIFGVKDSIEGLKLSNINSSDLRKSEATPSDVASPSNLRIPKKKTKSSNRQRKGSILSTVSS